MNTRRECVLNLNQAKGCTQKLFAGQGGRLSGSVVFTRAASNLTGRAGVPPAKRVAFCVSPLSHA